MSALFVGQVVDLAVNPFTRFVLARGVWRTLAGARLLSNVRYEAARERYCCGRGCIEGVLRPAPNTVSHESARNAARGHLYRAFRAADTVERESPVSLDDCAHSWTSGYGHM